MERPRIAILDDEAIVRRELTRGLEKEGYEVLDTQSGERGLALARKEELFRREATPESEVDISRANELVAEAEVSAVIVDEIET